MHRLRIEAVEGRPVIAKIGIQFADGSTQAVERPLNWNRRVFDIDLNGHGRRVNRVIVYSNPVHAALSDLLRHGTDA